MGKKLVGAIVMTAAALCLLGSPTRAAAQGNTWVGENLGRMIDSLGWRLGLIRLNAALTLTNAGYDTDVYYGFREEVPDWTFTAGLPVQIMVPLGKKVVLDLSDRPEYMFFLDTERERAWNNTFGGNIHFTLERVYIRAGGRTANVRRRMSPELDVNVRMKSDQLGGELLWQASAATSFAVIYDWGKYRYEDIDYVETVLSQLLDRETQSVNLVAYVQPSARARLSLDGQYGTHTFLNEVAKYRDARSYGVFGGVEFIPQAGEIVSGMNVRGGLRIGYMKFDIKDPLMTDGSGFSGDADVSADLTRRTSMNAHFARGFQFSIYSGATYYLSTSYGAGLTQQLSRKAGLSYDATFGFNSYPGDGGIEGSRNRRSTHTFSLDLRLARQLNMSLVARLARRTRDADDTVRRRNFFGLNLTYGITGGRMSAPLGGLDR